MTPTHIRISPATAFCTNKNLVIIIHLSGVHGNIKQKGVIQRYKYFKFSHREI
jgi:hypothetical protein